METSWLEPPFNMIIVGPTNCGKTEYLMSLLTGPYFRKFEYIIFICPTFHNNKTYDKKYIYEDEDVYVFPVELEQVDTTLRCVHKIFSGSNSLIVLDDCASSKDMKRRSDHLVNLGFSARHDNLSVWVLTQQYTSISKPFRENIGMLVLFYSPGKTDNQTIIKEYGMELGKEEVVNYIKELKRRPYSKLIFRLRHPYNISFSV